MTIIDYMNLPSVTKALHVETNIPYATANNNIIAQYKSGRQGSAFIYDILNRYGYKMLHLMGDTDGLLSLPGAW